jgi:CheY-like chemotaxis protein
LSTQTILLVDDNRTHLYALSKHLTGSGFLVLEASSVATAVELAIAQGPDAILLDINLPDGTGFDVCQQLKADSRTKHIPVVFHSATHDTASARSQAQDLGAASFLSYPINVEHLEHVIRAAILQSQQSHPSA